MRELECNDLVADTPKTFFSPRAGKAFEIYNITLTRLKGGGGNSAQISIFESEEEDLTESVRSLMTVNVQANKTFELRDMNIQVTPGNYLTIQSDLDNVSACVIGEYKGV